MSTVCRAVSSELPCVAEVAAALRRAIPPTLATGAEQDWPLPLFGRAEAAVHGIATCWAPTLSVLEEAAARGADLVISHEMLFYSYRRHDWWDEVAEEDKLPNRWRRQVLERHGISVLRYHSAVDGWRIGGTVAATARRLCFEGEGDWDGKYMAAYDISPRPLEALAADVKARLALPAVRFAGEPGRIIRRVALAVGGNGQSFSAVEPCLRLGADAIVFGELLDFTMRYALEVGLAVIETTHVSTEEAAMIEVADVLRATFPHLPVYFLDTGMPWRAV